MAKVVIDENVEIFLVHIVSVFLGSKMIIYRALKAQIALLIALKMAILA